MVLIVVDPKAIRDVVIALRAEPGEEEGVGRLEPLARCIAATNAAYRNIQSKRHYVANHRSSLFSLSAFGRAIKLTDYPAHDLFSSLEIRGVVPVCPSMERALLLFAIPL
jgi:hypothetical protein